MNSTYSSTSEQAKAIFYTALDAEIAKNRRARLIRQRYIQDWIVETVTEPLLNCPASVCDCGGPGPWLHKRGLSTRCSGQRRMKETDHG